MKNDEPLYELIEFIRDNKPWEALQEWSNRQWSAEKEQTPYIADSYFFQQGGRINGNEIYSDYIMDSEDGLYSDDQPRSIESDTVDFDSIRATVKRLKGNPRIKGNALCRDKSTGRLYECLSESQTINSEFVPLTKTEQRDMVGALVEPNNLRYTQSMLNSGIKLFRCPVNDNWKTNDVYIGCASDKDKNVVPMNASTGKFTNGPLSSDTFDNDYFIRRFPVNKEDMWRINQGVRFNTKGSLVFRNGVEVPYTFSTTMTPREYSMRNFRPVYFMDSSDSSDYYYLRSYSPADMRRIINFYSR